MLVAPWVGTFFPGETEKQAQSGFVSNMVFYFLQNRRTNKNVPYFGGVSKQ